MQAPKHIPFIVLLTVMLLAYSGPEVSASSQGKDPIDKWTEDQIAKDPSTGGEIHAYDKGSEMWDKEMNKIYKELMGRLDNNQQVALKEAQRNWIKFRDTEIQAITKIIEKLEGTMWLTVPSARLYKINRQRTMQLKDYLDLIHPTLHLNN